MMLQPIHIGAEARICMKAAVAPGATVSAGKVVGPLSCTLEAPFDGERGTEFAASCRPLLPAPDFCTQAFLGWPVIIACKVCSDYAPHLSHTLVPGCRPSQLALFHGKSLGVSVSWIVLTAVWSTG